MFTRRSAVLIVFVLLFVVALSSTHADRTREFGTNWSALYFNDIFGDGSSVYSETMPTGINVNWGLSSPDPVVQVDGWSARFSGFQLFDNRRYEFVLTSDDFVQLGIDGVTRLKRMGTHPLTTDRFQLNMTHGLHYFTIRYADYVEDAAIQFQYFVVPYDVTRGISGTITDHLGNLLLDAKVTAYDATTMAVASVVYTNSDGAYVMALDPGAYKLYAEHDGAIPEYYTDKYSFADAAVVTVAADGITANTDITFAATACLGGTLTEPDGVTAAANDNIYVYRAGDPPESSYYGAIYSTQTDVNGAYHLCGLIPDLYRVEAYDPSNTYPNTFYNGAFNAADAEMITLVSGEDHIDVDFSYLTYTMTPPVLTAPSGVSADAPSTFTWEEVSGADWYYVWLSNSQTGKVFNRWHSADVCTGGVCTVPADVTLFSGTYHWWVQAWSIASGYGEWSAPAQFSISFAAPPTALTPSGVIAYQYPSFLWEALPGATWYEIWVADASGAGKSLWYPADSACYMGYCYSAWDSVGLMSAGVYRWWVQGWSNELGFSGWSEALNFMQPLGAPVTSAPTGVIDTSTPNFVWQPTVPAEWYWVQIANPATGELSGNWFSAATYCTDSTCTVPSPITLADADYEWYVIGWHPVSGYGTWSASVPFTVSTAAPVTAPTDAPQVVPPDEQPPQIDQAPPENGGQ